MDEPAGGIYPDYIDTMGLINDAAWRRAAMDRSVVGRCRASGCDGFLQAGRPYEVGKITWYEARCLRHDCRHLVAAPGGRVLMRSQLASRQPHAMTGRREQWRKLVCADATGDG